MIDTPTFESFFEQQAKGGSYYESQSIVDQEMADEQEEIDRILDESQNEDQYRRELYARMFGGKLTARQYGVLMKISADGDQQDAINKIQEYKTKMEAKDNIRNAEETVESFRRKMVLKG